MADAIVTDVLARISADASNFVRNMGQAAGVADNFSKSLREAGNVAGGVNGSMYGLAESSAVVNKAMFAVGGAVTVATGAVVAFGVQSFQAAAQVNEMDVAMRAVGNATGLGYKALKEATIAIRNNGIEMASAQQMTLLYAKANLQLADASKIARVAQDLAVLSGSNSTDTAMRLTYAIMNQDTLMLRNIGITKTASDAYAEYARENNTVAKALTEAQKKQAITNMVIAEGAKVAGVYEAAMKEPAKVLRSFPRLINDIQVAVGQGLTQAFGPIILSAYNLTKQFSHMVREGGAFEPIVKAIGQAFTYMISPITKGIDAFKKFLEKIQRTSDLANSYRERVYGAVGATQKMNDKVETMAENFARFLPIVMAVAGAISTSFGASLLSGVPVLGSFLGMLNPIAVGLVILVATIPKVQEAFGRLISSVKPVLEFFKGFAVAVQGIFSGAVGILIGLINGLSNVFSNVFGWFKKHEGLLYSLGIGIGVVATAFGIYKGAITAWMGVQKAYIALQEAGILLTAWQVVAIGTLVGAIVYAWKNFETFRNVVTGVLDAVAKVVGSAIGFVLNSFASLLEAFARAMSIGGSFRDFFILAFNTIIKVVGYIIAGVLTHFASLVGAFGKIIGSSDDMREGLAKVFGGILDLGKTLASFLIRSLANVVGLFAGILEAVDGFGEGWEQGFNKIGKFISDFAKGVMGILGQLLKGVWGAAKSMVSGLVNAVKGIFTGANDSAQASANSISSWTNKTVGFAATGVKALRGIQRSLESTANKIEDFSGINVGRSLVNGLVDASNKASSVLTGMANSVLAFANKDWGTGIADTAVAAATVAAAWLRGVAGKVIDFTKDGFTKNLTEGIGDFMNLMDGFLGGMKDQLDKTTENLFDPVNSALDDVADGATDSAQKAADRLKRISDAAKSALEEIKKQAQDVLGFSENVKKAITDFGGIATLAPEQGVPVTAGMILDNMRQRLAKISEFGNNLRELARMGLNNTSLQELISAGPIAGGAMAKALVKEGESAISQVNALQSGISMAGTAIGDIATRSQYGMGIAEAQGIVGDTNIEIKEGAVQIVFGADVTAESRQEIRDTVNSAIKQALDDLAREIANQRTA